MNEATAPLTRREKSFLDFLIPGLSSLFNPLSSQMDCDLSLSLSPAVIRLRLQFLRALCSAVGAVCSVPVKAVIRPVGALAAEPTSPAPTWIFPYE